MKKYLLVTFLVIICLAIFTFYCNQIIDNNGVKYCYSSISEIPTNKVALLLGANKTVKGSPNLYFTYRIKAALSLYQAGKVQYIIVSGDNHTHEYNEPEDMKQALLAGGVPESAIIMDFAGFRTLDSVVRCKEIFGQNQITIISQPFHNYRAIYIAQHFGIEAIGFNAQDVPQQMGMKTKLREVFARAKVFLDLYILQTSPKFLGEKIVIP
jgi:SanA protein